MPIKTNNKLVAALLYACYAFALAFFLLYYLFPYSKTADYLLYRYGNQIPFEVQVDDIKPQFPPVSFHVPEISIFHPGHTRTNPLALIAPLSIRPSLWALLKGEKIVQMNAGLYGGKLIGVVRVSENSTSNLELDISVASLDLARMNHKALSRGITLAGLSDLNVSFSGNAKQWFSGKGAAVLKIKEGRVNGLNRFFIPLNSLDGCGLDAVMNFSGGKLEIERCRLTSNQGWAQAEGAVILAPELSRCRLNISLRITLEPQIQKKYGLPAGQMNMVLKGTVQNPRLAFGR